jgi:4-hydroxy-4-methyl-2-oxoglutarate aldolase
MQQPLTDAERLDLIRERLYTAVLADVLDQLGHRQSCMSARVRPLSPGSVVVGRARTALATEVYALPDKPYAGEIEMLDGLQHNQVLVYANQGSTRAACFGELFATAAKTRGAGGAIIDGYVRDMVRIKQVGLPVFATGLLPYDSRGRLQIVAIEQPIEAGGILVNPGDLVCGDDDGVVVVPRELEEQAIALGLEKVAGEKRALKHLQAGGYLREVWERYGVL